MTNVCVIPGSAVNRYSPQGDLAAFGDTTLLEWKIAQAKSVHGVNKIIITTKDDQIALVAKRCGVEVLGRSSTTSLTALYVDIAKALRGSTIVWLNPTVPFMGPLLISQMIIAYQAKENGAVGIVASSVINEYLFDENGPINFAKSKSAFSRSEIKTLWRITNGAYIAEASEIEKWGRCFCDTPLQFEVPWLASLEIKNADQMKLFPSLVSLYFESEK